MCPYCVQQTILSQSKCHNSKWCRDSKFNKKHLSYKLCEIYSNELKRLQHKARSVIAGSRLLDKLVGKDKPELLHVNLYSDGFSVGLASKSEQNERIAYENDTFLNYIDDGLLPPILANLIDVSGNTNLYQSGNVQAIITNYTHVPNTSYYTVLRTNTLLAISDAASIAADWSLEDRLHLESALVLATSEPLCLEPDVSVALVDNYISHKQKLFTSIRKPTIKKLSPRKCPLYDFLEAKCRQPKTFLRDSLEAPDLAVPMSIDVPKLARPLGRPEIPLDNSTRLVQEYLLETALSGCERVTKVSILQTPIDEQYYGVLVTQCGETKSHCTFLLGTLSNVHLYLNQFREIFTEEGRKAVKITHLVPGKAPVVRHTPAYLQVQQAVQAQNAQHSSAQAQIMVQQLTPQTSARVPGSPQGQMINIAQSPGSQSPLQQALSNSPQNIQAVVQQIQNAAQQMSSSQNSNQPSGSGATHVHSVQLNSDQLQAVVQQVKNIVHAQSGNAQVVLQHGSQQNIVLQNSAPMQGVVHQMPASTGKPAIQQMMQNSGIKASMSTLSGSSVAQHIALHIEQQQTSQNMAQNSGKTVSVQSLEQQGLTSAQVNNNSLTQHKTFSTTTSSTTAATQNIAEQIAAQITQRQNKPVMLQNVQPAQAANNAQIQTIVQQITQQINQQQKSQNAQVSRSIPSMANTSIAANSSGQIQNVVQHIQNIANQSSGKSQAGHQIVQTSAQHASGLYTTRIQPAQSNVTPANISQQYTGKPQIMSQHGSVPIAQSILPNSGIAQPIAGSSTSSGQDNRTAMQILSAAVGKAHQATSIQLAAIQRQLQNQRDKKN